MRALDQVHLFKNIPGNPVAQRDPTTAQAEEVIGAIHPMRTSLFHPANRMRNQRAGYGR